VCHATPETLLTRHALVGLSARTCIESFGKPLLESVPCRDFQVNNSGDSSCVGSFDLPFGAGEGHSLTTCRASLVRIRRFAQSAAVCFPFCRSSRPFGADHSQCDAIGTWYKMRYMFFTTQHNLSYGIRDKCTSPGRFELQFTDYASRRHWLPLGTVQFMDGSEKLIISQNACSGFGKLKHADAEDTCDRCGGRANLNRTC
jgi:hypothetical protein